MKKVFFILTILFFGQMLPALEIFVAPVNVIDNGVNNRSSESFEFSGKLAESLSSIQKNSTILFQYEGDQGIPDSFANAMQFCKANDIQYLLYGYTERRGNSVYSEMRLLDYESKSVLMTFFSADSEDYNERIVTDLAVKITDFIETEFGYSSSLRNEVTRTFGLEIPLSIGYWTPAQSAWTSTVTGTVNIMLGITIVPDYFATSLSNKRAYISLSLYTAYRYALGDPGTYDLSFHAIDTLFLSRYHLVLSNVHELYLGAGFMYSLNLYSIAEKYGSEKESIDGIPGLCLSLGYQFNVTDKIGIILDNTFLYLLYDPEMVVWTPKLGVTYKIYQRTMEK